MAMESFKHTMTKPKAKSKKESDPDHPTFVQAMSGPDFEEWEAAMRAELETLINMCTWTTLPTERELSNPLGLSGRRGLLMACPPRRKQGCVWGVTHHRRMLITLSPIPLLSNGPLWDWCWLFNCSWIGDQAGGLCQCICASWLGQRSAPGDRVYITLVNFWAKEH